MKTFLPLVFSLFCAVSQATTIASSPAEAPPLPNGVTLPAVTLTSETDQAVPLNEHITKPTVLVFYRGGWCPYCNTQLAGLRDIEPKLAALGYQIIAITPDSPGAIAASRKDTKGGALPYTLLSDSQFAAMTAFGVAYYLDAKTSKTYLEQYQLNLNKEAGTGKVVLPVPAVYLVDKTGLVQFSYSHINYKVRLQPELLLHAARLALETE